MNGENLQLITFYANCGKKDWVQGQQQKEINDVKGPGTVNEHVEPNWFRCFK